MQSVAKINYYKMLKTLFLIYTSIVAVSAQSTNTLWYNQPAEHFEESLVLGNGKMGASVFGGILSDKIFLNDITLWTGEPVQTDMNPEAYKWIPLIREALKNENYKLADSLSKNVQGKFSESYAPLGTMFIEMKHSVDVQNYYRELNISEAISKTAYEINNIKFSREYFVSHPDKIMVIRLTSNKKGSLAFDVKFQSLLKFKLNVNDNLLEANGYSAVHAEPNYRNEVRGAVVFDSTRGTRFSTLFKIKNSDGQLVNTDSTIGIRNASEALLFISTATSFNGFDNDPATQGLPYQQNAKEQLNGALKKTFSQLKDAHLKDHQKFFNRVALDLGKTTAPDIPTNERLKRYAEGTEDKNLEILYFQYGRYLLISSSRTPGIPANLQGLWNPYMRPPWSSNYTININAEENYWLAENTNLSEMHLPMMQFIKNISTTGAVTAKTFFGVSNGWAACHNSDVWAMSNPVGNFGEGNPQWANWQMGGVWLSTHLWEHFVFTQDKEFLKNEGYSIMKGAVEFCLDWMVEDKEGKLVTSPSTSPENRFITPTGYHGATLYGGTADLAMIRELFQQTIEAQKILNVDNDLKNKVEQALNRLHPYQVGKKGNLQEWYYDWEDVEPKHRHQSHLFGLYPGHHITPSETPELVSACRKTLEIKGDETTGWSKGWRINLWARLWDGNRAYKMYRELLKYVEPDAIRPRGQGGGGTYPNLFDAHPPFQIDGNFGGAAAIAEMLVQSSVNEIRILPALPDAWPEGKVKGLVARGGFFLDLEWEKLQPKKISVSSEKGGMTKIIHGEKQQTINLKPGEKVTMNWK